MTTQHDVATHPSLELCVQFSEDGTHIRKWSRFPFDGGERLYSHPATPAPSDEVARLREALIAAGRNSGALLADDVSTDFLMLIPAEVEARIALLREALARMVKTYANMQDGDGEPCPDVAFARAARGPEVGEGCWT